jgi:hypothetical protein
MTFQQYFCLKTFEALFVFVKEGKESKGQLTQTLKQRPKVTFIISTNANSSEDVY